jgi:Nif-specific regulatory protein
VRAAAAGEGGGGEARGGKLTILVSEAAIERVAGERTAILSRNAPADGRFEGDSVAEGGIATVIAAPICRPGARDEVLAVLYADRRGSRPPFTETELDLLSAAAEQAGGVLHHVSSSAELREANRNLLRDLAGARPIVGQSRAVAEIQAFIRKAAPTSMTVLIRGETGTGKELVASAIHYQSPRQGRPFVAINCAALPETLLESELFGHEKGAFTGAVARKKGRFELAHTGTIFLDEIAELSPGCQAKLLRLLEERRFERVGGTEAVEVDVRVVAATNRDLARAIEEGTFREDLFYRLNVLAVALPPLRDRVEDIPFLVRYFLAEMGFADERKILSPAAERKLLEYSWPGNIRQLRNAVESAVVLRDGALVEPEDLVLPERPAAAAGPGEAWRPEPLEEVQRRHVLRVLEHTGGNKKRAAEILGIERCTLYARLRSYGIGAGVREKD